MAPLPISLERRARIIADTGMAEKLYGSALREAIYKAALAELFVVAGERRKFESEKAE